MLTDLEYRVWTQYLLSADDFGVMRCSAISLQVDNDHLANRPKKLIDKCLTVLVTSGLLHVFEHQGRRFVFQHDWQTWQKIEFPRATIEPRPPEDAMGPCDDATQELFEKHPGGQRGTGISAKPELHIRGVIASGMRRVLPAVTSLTENARLGNSYADILITLADSRVVVIEVKRHGLHPAAIGQVKNYAVLLRSQYPNHTIVPVVVGRGLARALAVDTIKAEGVTAILFDDAMNCTVVADAAGVFPEKFSLLHQENNSNLTRAEQPHPSRAGAPAERLTANGTRLVANGSEGESCEPLAAWLSMLKTSYPTQGAANGPMVDSVFFAVFVDERPRPASEVWAQMLDNLENQKQGHQWRVKRMIPRMDRWLSGGAWKQRHDAAPPSTLVNDKTVRTMTSADHFAQGGTHGTS